MPMSLAMEAGLLKMYKIILIDDDTDTLETIAAFFDWNQMGLDLVKTADNGVSGLDAILFVKPDIVLIDIRMPGMDGLEVIEATRQNGLDPYFIVMSGYADFKYAQTALRLSVSEYILKPYSPTDLSQAFEKAVRELEKRIPVLIMPQYKLPRGGSDGLIYPMDKEKVIMSILFTGRKEDLTFALDDFIKQIFSRNDDNDALACVSLLYGAITRLLMERRKMLSIDHLEGIRWKDRDLAKSLRQFLLSVLDETYSIIHAESTINPAVISAEKYIRIHYKEKLTLDIVAEAVCITPTYLSTLFSKSLGTSFVSYVNQIRIEQAQKLLLDPKNDPITLAERVGFGDTKYFCHVFRRVTGTTPTQYRNQMLSREK
jgi:YesN/AraC family two-component response regulator